MDSEIPALERALNPFVERMVTGGVDPRLILLAAHPGAAGPGVCAPAPLGSGSCGPHGPDTNPPRFFHHALRRRRRTRRPLVAGGCGEFGKVGVSSRAAATAYAYEHKLL